MMRRRRLIVFARLPVPGQVKTRLAATLGATVALDVHRRLLDAAVLLAEQAPVDERELRFAAPAGPADPSAMALPQALAAAGWRVGPQTGADLGARMHVAMCDALAAGRLPVLIGSDCPVLRADDVGAAFDALATHEAVFAPAEDGGYALVGVARPLPTAFHEIAWGTDRVMVTTRRRLDDAGARIAELRRVWDVDIEADLRRWERGA